MSLDDTIKPDDWRDVKVPVFGGLNKALDPDNLEMGDLVRGENICLIDDTITMANGFDPYHDTVDNDPWVGDAMKPFKYRLTDGTLGQILFTTAGLYRDNGSAWLQVTGGTFSGDVNSLFSVIAIPWADVIVFTNGLDPVQVYDPATQTITNLQGPGGANIYAKALAVYDSSLFLLNTVESGTARPQRLRYCDKGDITNWDTGVAGFRDLLDGTDPIMCGRLLGTYLIVYRTRGIHRVDISINDLERFQIDNMIPDNGVTSIDAVINVEKNRHLVWGRDNFYLYDGGFELEPIGSDVTDFMFTPFRADDGSAMFSAEDLTQVHRHHLMYFESLNEILCVYQSENDTELTSALLYRYGEKTWTTRKFPSRPVRGSDLASPFVHISWDDLVGTWDDLIGSWLDLIGPTGQIYPIFASTLGGVETNTPTFKFDFLLTTQWVGTDIVATDIPTTFETKDYSEYPYTARLDWVDLRIDAPQSVTVEFSIDEGTTWEILRTFTTTGLTLVRLHKQIHYESIRFRITGFFWELKSMNLRVTPETEIGTSEVQPTFAGPGVPALVATEGSVILDMSVTRGSVGIKDFFVYRSIDNAPFVHLLTQEVETVVGTLYSAQYTDNPPVFETNVRYYVVARDTLLNLSADSNIEEIVAGGTAVVIGSASGDRVWIAEEDLVFTEVLLGFDINQMYKILWLEPHQRWVVVAQTGTAISTDETGTAWTNTTPVGWGAATTADAAYDPIQDVLVIVADSGDLFYSLDGGATFTDTGISNVYSTVSWDPVLGKFAIPNDSTSQLRPVFSSPDGVNWTQHANIDSMGCNASASNGAGIIGAVGANSGVGFGGGFWSTSTGGPVWTNNGLTDVNSFIRSMGHDGANWAMFGQIGSNVTWSYSPSGNNGTWTNRTVGTSGTVGTPMDCAEDRTRSRWFVVGRNRAYVSSDLIGTAWTQILFVSANLNAVGVRPA